MLIKSNSRVKIYTLLPKSVYIITRKCNLRKSKGKVYIQVPSIWLLIQTILILKDLHNIGLINRVKHQTI